MFLARPPGQPQRRPTDSLGISGDVDRMNAIIGTDADHQQNLSAPTGRDHDARCPVDEHDSTGARPLSEPASLLGNLGGAAQHGWHIGGDEGRVDGAHHLRSQQFE